MADEVSGRDAIAFRMRAHALTQRLGGDRLLDVAGRCAVQDSPPGSALLALNARLDGVSGEQLAQAIADRSLLRTWSMRGAPFCLPTRDAAVFTTGALPPTEESMRHLLTGVVPALDALGLSLAEAVDLTRAHVADALTGRQLAIGDLGAGIAERIAPTLPAARRTAWEAPGPYSPGQPLGEGVVHFCLRILTLEQVVCFGPRAGNAYPFVLVDEWLGGPVPQADPQVARAELVRRYLRCYGPATRRGFAVWLGLRAGDLDPWWSLIEDELTPVRFGGAKAWIRTEDRDALSSSPPPWGVRLLPPRDPYTQLRDRETILDPRHHRQVWRTIGEPGAVLADGRVVGSWRPQAKGRRLTLTVSAFEPLAQQRRAEIREEAERLAALRGASTVEVVCDGPEG